jgi:hypothetical protein
VLIRPRREIDAPMPAISTLRGIVGDDGTVHRRCQANRHDGKSNKHQTQLPTYAIVLSETRGLSASFCRFNRKTL